MDNLKIRDKINVVFEIDDDGDGVVARLPGGYAGYVENYGSCKELADDEWKVLIIEKNRKLRCYYLRLVKLVKAADGLDRELADVTDPQMVRAVRVARKDVLAARAEFPAGSVELAAKLIDIVNGLPRAYRLPVADEALELMMTCIRDRHPWLVPLVNLLRYTIVSGCDMYTTSLLTEYIKACCVNEGI